MGSLRWRVLNRSGLSLFVQEGQFQKILSGQRNIQSLSRPSAARFKISKESNEEVKEETTQDYGLTTKHPFKQIGLNWTSKSELARHLIKNQIHNDHGLFVTNKPFGVGVRRPSERNTVNKAKLANSMLHQRGLPSCPYTLEDLLPELRHLLKKPDLVLVRSTEKLTSGPAVFAYDDHTATRFTKCVSSSKMHFDTLYKYHVVTTLPPILPKDPFVTERLGIAIKRPVGVDFGQPVVTPDFSINSIKRREVVSAHVQSKLLQIGHGGPAYLFEINTNTVANNFLRIFCVDRLAPILGDHLYSDRVQTLKGIPAKIDPTHLIPGSNHQKLSHRLLQALQLDKPEDSLIIPVHIHLRSYKVRKFIDPSQADVCAELEAPYPDYFKWTCEQVGIVLDADAVQH